MMRRAVGSLILAALVIASTLAVMQGPFDESSFAYQQYRGYSGTLFTLPTPLLVTSDGVYLLTRPGKFGVDADAWNGRAVRLRGALIQSGNNRMLEIEPGSVGALGATPQSPPLIESLGIIEVTGEIADGKCYYGVMNPGRGKVHRDCAVRCLSGGAPPVFLVRDASGSLRTLVLTGLGREILQYVAEPVRMRGKLERFGSQIVFHADAGTLRRE
jgi:hypothetical protein